MKISLIIFFFLFSAFFTWNQFKTPEGERYKLLKSFDGIEIRSYENQIYAAFTPSDSDDRSSSFRIVAGYIFGGNDQEKKIAMTSPVVMRLYNDNEMAFVMPADYQLDKLPIPINTKVKIYEEAASIKASLRYSGYSNSSREKNKMEQLKAILMSNEIFHENDFEVLVYNAPFQFLFRRNEIVVTVNNFNIKEKQTNNFKKIYFGTGCFWCTEAVFEDVTGVFDVRNGYSGGVIKNPTYSEVSKGQTDHAEVCEVTYDSDQVSLVDLLELFFVSHDPTTKDRQGNDVGRHYRSIILYTSSVEEEIARKVLSEMNQEVFDEKIITEINPFEAFYPAENYHQNYYVDNKYASYCRVVISPKVEKAKKKLSRLYR